MAMYLVCFESNMHKEGETNVVVDGRKAVDEKIKEWYDDGYMDDDEMPVVFQLGKKMKAMIETKIILEGE